MFKIFKNRRKEIKGFIIGFIFITVLSGTVAMANPYVREIVFGVRVSYNGAVVNFDADSQPFIMGGRTFLPVRAIAGLVGLDVGFADGVVTLNSAEVAVPLPAPTPTPTPPPTPTPQPVDAAAFEQEVLRLVNIERANNGLNPLQWNDSLADAARAHSADMAARNYFSHTSPDGVGMGERIRNAGIGISYRLAGENISRGTRTPEAVVNSWMNSPGHRANILHRQFTHIGIGFHDYYWTQKFVG